MKFDELKKARWTLVVGGEGEEEKHGNWLSGYYSTKYKRGFSFEANAHGKTFRIMYWDIQYDGTCSAPLCMFDEPVTEATERDVVNWVEQTYTPYGFKMLYEDLFRKGILNNF